MKDKKFPTYRIKLLSYSHFPEPVNKDDIIIFSDQNEHLFSSLEQCKSMELALKKLNINYKVIVE